MPPRIVAICKRFERFVVSEAFETPTGQTGYHPCVNWPDLEAQAQEEAQHASFGGPFVFPCSPALAAQAFWGDVLELPDLASPSAPFQALLFGESEAHP